MEEKNRIDALAEMADPKNIPKDLIVIAVWMLLAVLSIYVPFINETFIRVIFTVPVILFIPGYVLIAALFPEKKSIDAVHDPAVIKILLKDLERAEKFIYLEFFIIEEGKFWNSILDILNKKVKEKCQKYTNT